MGDSNIGADAITMNLEICIPTLGRSRQLTRAIASIYSQEVPCKVAVAIMTEPEALTTSVNNLCSERASTTDVVMVLADDIELKEGCLAAVMSEFQKAEDLDKCVGLCQSNIQFYPQVTEHAFWAAGRLFMDGLLWQPFCPDYYHFSADTELGEYARWTGRFVYRADAKLTHYHPDASAEKRDATHAASRIRQDIDAETRGERKRRGLVWGKTFDRVKP